MAEDEKQEEEPTTVGTRYGRGGYRRSRGRYTDVRVGNEKPRENPDEPIALDGSIMDGTTLGPQDPAAIPNADSDVGGPPLEVAVSRGGEGVPPVGQPTEPMVAGDRQRELDELEVEVAGDRELTPEVMETEEIDLEVAERVEPPSNPIPVTERVDVTDETKDMDAVNVSAARDAEVVSDGLVSDAAMADSLAEEPAGEERAQGEGLTQGQLDEEAGEPVEDGGEEAPAVLVEKEGPDIEISETEAEDESEGAGETF